MKYRLFLFIAFFTTMTACTVPAWAQSFSGSLVEFLVSAILFLVSALFAQLTRYVGGKFKNDKLTSALDGIKEYINATVIGIVEKTKPVLVEALADGTLDAVEREKIYDVVMAEVKASITTDSMKKIAQGLGISMEGAQKYVETLVLGAMGWNVPKAFSDEEDKSEVRGYILRNRGHRLGASSLPGLGVDGTFDKLPVFFSDYNKSISTKKGMKSAKKSSKKNKKQY